MKTLALTLAAVALAACSNTLPGNHAPSGAMTYDQVNTCVASYFGADRLDGRPQIAYMDSRDLVAGYGSAYGATQIGNIAGMAGPVSNDYIFLAPGLNVADHNTVLTHEVIHQYQARTLGSYSPGSDAGERHAQEHHFAWRGCVR